MKVFAISFKEKCGKQVVQVKPHVLLVMAEDEIMAGEIARREIKEMGGDLRTLKWAGTTCPILIRPDDSYICWFGDIDEPQ